ncbi:diguanylate cyclase/phosphodiesterase (GGDEF & EAL domains) with PAS/PAC sensor(s) [Olavius algarvensis Delta 1 endosymbiont]|nr:diguanylate cyclase/phosphodiesterase (GGDEF & EAL domains) with PAS/PAC sensor(s) [Olavius algarvensis Delta 1 endosymbiont]
MERILVIDDEASIRKALSIGLACDDFEIDLASDGRSGIQLGQNQIYDILIADLSLPDMDGLEVIEKIKFSSPDIIPIIITGNGSLQSSLEALRLEVNDYLEKPLSLKSVKDAIARGLKKRERMRRAIEHRAYQNRCVDSLTGLPDRSLFMERLKGAITGSEGPGDGSVAVFLINVEQFKKVNDLFGLHTGDLVLAELSCRLQACVRDIDTIARMNGDEFAVLVEAIDSHENLIAIAERCQRAAAKAFSINGTRVNITVNIGIVAKTHYYQSPDEVLRDAESALARCKEQGGGFKVFDQHMLEQAMESLQLEVDMRLGVQNQEFLLHYQPIVRVADLQLVGLEAMIHWNHPERGLIYPDEIIAKAEELDLIHQIGNWLIGEGCRQMQAWRSTWPGCEKIDLHINIPGQRVLQPGQADVLAAIVRQQSVDPQTVQFDFNDSFLQENSAALTETLLAMKDMGFKLAIDGFGTGFSSFSYLQQFSLDALKIGQSFISRLVDDPENYEIVKSIVGLAKKLGLIVVAEGVSSEAQFNQVKSLDFDMLQGPWVGEPAEASTVIERIKKCL